MLTDYQLETAERLRNGIEQIVEAVRRLNDLGVPVGVPPIAIRFLPMSASISGEIHYIGFVSDLVAEERMCRFDALLDGGRA